MKHADGYHDKPEHSHPQTISFEAEFTFGNLPTPDGSLHVEVRRYHTIEGMTRDVATERRRRAKAHRVTSVRDRSVYTEYGRRLIMADPEAKARHADINVGEWKTLRLR
jgi:hypothetical protein